MNFSGLYTAIITPFNDDESVDYESFVSIIESQIEGGVDGLVVLGTTGESPTVSPEEHNEIIKKAVEIVNGRTKIIAGTGSNCTAEAIEYSVHAEKAGVDGLLQVSPYYNKPTQKGLFEHFTAIANAVNIPIILYNIAGRCGVNIETETVVKLAEHQNIIAVKEASGNLDQMRDVLARTPDDFLVFSGDDGLTLELAKMGGNGVISVISNILPSETKQFVDFCLNGEYEAAQKMQEKFEPLFRDLFIETNPEPIKTLMAEEGFCKEVFRLPITTMLPENKVTLLKTWNEYKNN